MGRIAKPWYRTSADAWYVWWRGKQHMLARGRRSRAKAEAAFDVLKAKAGEAGRGTTVRLLVELFLDDVKANRAPSTYCGYRKRLASLVERYGRMDADDVRPMHLTRWASGLEVSDSTRWLSITVACRCWSWGAKQGLCKDSVRGTPRPKLLAGWDLLPDGAAERLIEAAPDRALRDAIVALWQTGARPSEVISVEARHVDLESGVWRLPSKATRRTGRLQVIRLTPRMVELTRELMALHPEGPLFRNTRGKPMNRNKLGLRIRLLAEKLGIPGRVSPKSFRHKFVTDALAAGVGDAIMTALVEHADTSVIHKNYSHVRRLDATLREAVGRVRQ